jgi:hypothetical protein
MGECIAILGACYGIIIVAYYTQIMFLNFFCLLGFFLMSWLTSPGDLSGLGWELGWLVLFGVGTAMRACLFGSGRRIYRVGIDVWVH